MDQIFLIMGDFGKQMVTNAALKPLRRQKPNRGSRNMMSPIHPSVTAPIPAPNGGVQISAVQVGEFAALVDVAAQETGREGGGRSRLRGMKSQKLTIWILARWILAR